MYQLVLFDLDGTIVDSGDAIVGSIRYAINSKGYSMPSDEELYQFVGPPLKESFAKHFNLKENEADEMLALYRKDYASGGMLESVPYEGIYTLLQQLEKNKTKIALATSKPEFYAKQILDHHNLSQYFDTIIGATLDSTLKKKTDIIAKALKSHSDIPKSKIIMVGDREYDIIGAKNNQIPSIGVLYGYGDEYELTNAGANFICSNMLQLTSILLSI